MSYMSELSCAGVEPREYVSFLNQHKKQTGIELDFDTCVELTRIAKLKTHYFTVIDQSGKTCGHKHFNSFDAYDCLGEGLNTEMVSVKKSIPLNEIKPYRDLYEKHADKKAYSFSDFLNEVG
jgi:hypothetical protein